MRIARVVVGLVVLSFLSVPLESRGTPALQAISPGELESVSQIEDRCPTFLWTLSTGARAIEVLVYEWESDHLMASLGKGPEARSKLLPPGASGWTPSLDACLERGKRYVWLVRTEGESGESTWSAPRFFEIADVPNPAELRDALSVLRRYLDPDSREVLGIPGPEILEIIAAPATQAPVEAAGTATGPLQVESENVLFGLERKKKSGIICPASSYCTDFVQCSSGKKALSGGIEVEAGNSISGFQIVTSYPSAIGWSATVLNGPVATTWTLHAICARPD